MTFCSVLYESIEHVDDTLLNMLFALEIKFVLKIE